MTYTVRSAAALAVTSLTFVACGGDDKDESGAEKEPSTAKPQVVTVRVSDRAANPGSVSAPSGSTLVVRTSRVLGINYSVEKAGKAVKKGSLEGSFGGDLGVTRIKLRFRPGNYTLKVPAASIDQKDATANLKVE